MIERDCRLISRVGDILMPMTDVVPRADTPAHSDERERLADFLGNALMKPLHHSMQQHRMNVEHSLDTMTLAERIAIEIEMTERTKVSHSYDYDALR